MATAKKDLTNTWQAISAAGESGTCWLKTGVLNGGNGVVVDHSDSGVGSLNENKAREVFKPIGNHDSLILSADSAGDIFYAKCVDDGATAELAVDVI